jgi:hypothetical protein
MFTARAANKAIVANELAALQNYRKIPLYISCAIGTAGEVADSVTFRALRDCFRIARHSPTIGRIGVSSAR